MNKSAILLLGIFLLGCSSGYARLTYDFEKMPSEPTIFYDSEAEDLALQVEESLLTHISQVKAHQYSEFKDLDALKVYIFSSKERYSKFSGSTPLSRGSAITNEIYISPIIRDRIDTLPGIVTHELSHAHLRQYVGTWRYWTEIPGWFHEGLAVEVSDGGGAEKISDEEAIAAIRSGERFTPREKSGLLGHQFANDYDLTPHLYYRQSNLFVRYLMNQNPEAFKNAYLALIEGSEFSDIWVSEYGKSIPQLWQEFLSHVQA